MKIRQALKAVAAVAAILCTGPAFANEVIGLPPNPNDGNCYPWGCSYSGQYQQVYTASAFSGPITIGDLEFFNTSFNDGASSMNAGTWTISLSTTAADWNTLSGTFASNIGGDNTVVFSGDLSQPWAFGDTLHILLTTPFAYDPGNGNLLMDVVVSGASSPGGNIFFDVHTGDGIMGRVFDIGGGIGAADSDFGLVTGFSPAAVPEPASLALLGIGLAGLGAIRRREQAA